MKVFNGLVIQALFCITLVSTRCTNPNEMEVCNDDSSKCFCKTCLSCSPGFGLNYECGGKISDKQTLKCEPCKHKMTYSNTNSSETCQPCPKCDGHKMLQPCTVKTATKCSPDECDKDHMWNPVVEVCELHLQPTPLKAATTKVNPTTHNLKPTPSQSRTKKVYPNITSYLSTTKETKKPKTNFNGEETAKDPSLDREKSKHSYVILNVILVILVAVIATFIFTKIKKIKSFLRERFREQESSPQESHPLNKMEGGSEDPSPELSRQAYPWPTSLLLNSIPKDLQSQIDIRIASPESPLNGWKQLGTNLQVSEDTMLKIGNEHQAERGSALFAALNAEKNKLKLSTFIDALIVLNRIDIVELVKDYYALNSP